MEEEKKEQEKNYYDELEQGGNKKLPGNAVKKTLISLALAAAMVISGKAAIDNYNEEYIELNTPNNNRYKITDQNSLSLYNPEKNDYVVLTDFKNGEKTCLNVMTDQTVCIDDYGSNGYYAVNLFNMIKNGELDVEIIGHNKYQANTSDLTYPVRIHFIKLYGYLGNVHPTPEESLHDYNLLMLKEDAEGNVSKCPIDEQMCLPLYNNSSNKFIIIKIDPSKRYIELLSGDEVTQEEFVGSSPINIFNYIEEGKLPVSYETDANGKKTAIFNEKDLVDLVYESKNDKPKEM